VRDERTTRTFAAAAAGGGGGGADVQARSLHARVAFEDVYKRKENPESFFVIFKFIKIQKRKKKEGRKKNNDRVILLSASRWTTHGLLDICITVYCISLRPLLLYWSIPGNI
jgi:hypothetical protein